MNGRGVVALVLQLGFLSVAFVGRTIAHRRTTGDSGFRWQRHDRSARVSGALFAAAIVVGIVGVGFDSGKTQKDAVRAGELLGSITQNPVGIGECVVDSLAKALAGETLPTTIDTGFYWYDATNMDSPEIAAVLYD